MVDGPHPDSVLRYGVSGRQVQLKVHQCVWSGNSIPNSLAAIQDCYRARVAWAEIDIAMLADEDFLVVHDTAGPPAFAAADAKCRVLLPTDGQAPGGTGAPSATPTTSR